MGRECLPNRIRLFHFHFGTYKASKFNPGNATPTEFLLQSTVVMMVATYLK